MLARASIHARFSERCAHRAEATCVDGRLHGHDDRSRPLDHPEGRRHNINNAYALDPGSALGCASLARDDSRGSQGARRPGASACLALHRHPDEGRDLRQLQRAQPLWCGGELRGCRPSPAGRMVERWRLARGSQAQGAGHPLARPSSSDDARNGCQQNRTERRRVTCQRNKRGDSDGGAEGQGPALEG